MSVKRIRTDLSLTGIRRAIVELERIQRRIPDMLEAIEMRIADEVHTEAEQRYASAQYDGYNDVTVSDRPEGKGYIVEAEGNAVQFIEFGTGVYNADPKGGFPPGVLEHGQYGLGHGRNRAWVYYGLPGTNGQEFPDHPGKILTHGNPANDCMYDALYQVVWPDHVRIAREEFDYVIAGT